MTKRLALALVLLLSLILSACHTTPRDQPPATAPGEAVVVIRDHYIAGTGFVHSFVQVSHHGDEWIIEEKTHRERQGSHLQRVEGWREEGRNRITLRGELAQAAIRWLSLAFQSNELGESYNALTSNNSNGFVAGLLRAIGLDADEILSGGAWGK